MSAVPSPLIFLVDDQPTWLRALGRVLRQAGATVRAFEDPRSVLDVIEADLPDLAMIDFDLGPGGTGDALARQLREALGSECPPLMLLTAQLGDVDDRALVVFDAALSKDTPPDALVATLMREASAYRVRQSTLRVKAGSAQDPETGTGSG